MIIFNKCSDKCFLFIATDKGMHGSKELTLHIIHVFFIKFSKLNIFHWNDKIHSLTLSINIGWFLPSAEGCCRIYMTISKKQK